jgi:hypothetical protein
MYRIIGVSKRPTWVHVYIVHVYILVSVPVTKPTVVVILEYQHLLPSGLASLTLGVILVYQYLLPSGLFV